MPSSSNADHRFQNLNDRLQTLLPEIYQGSCDDVLPLLMGSAALKYGADGKVAWNEIWGSFCHLAMAGGPPHKGKLLEPARPDQIAMAPERYSEVVTEICRGITMVSGLHAEISPNAGWVRVYCPSAVMSGWLARAIVMENVSARFEDLWLDLPAGPHYSLAKEIKNVVTVIAKTTHYWVDHTSPEQHQAIADLFATMESESPLVQIALLDQDTDSTVQQVLSEQMGARISEATGISSSSTTHEGWLGLGFPDVVTAIRMMRFLVACNTLARREGTTVLVPVNPMSDSDGESVTRAVIAAYSFAVAEKLL